MRTWDVGPFDNDTAADWCDELQDAGPSQRVGLIRDAVTAVPDSGEDYLDSDLAFEAIAAAAIVAAQLPGAATTTSPYAPDFLVDGNELAVPDDIVALAVRALDRIVGENSEWRELWEESGRYPSALAELHRIRADSTRLPETGSADARWSVGAHRCRVAFGLPGCWLTAMVMR